VQGVWENDTTKGNQDMTLTLDQALTIARETMAEGERRGMLPLAVMVLDHAGQPLALLRDHRSSLHRADIATAKAAGCIAMGLGGRELAKRAAGNPARPGRTHHAVTTHARRRTAQGA